MGKDKTLNISIAKAIEIYFYQQILKDLLGFIFLIKILCFLYIYIFINLGKLNKLY